jgi:REP element-mobilizing transposase RayT
MYGAEGIYFVTARTLQGRLLLRPSGQVREVVGGILARAARRYGVKLRGFVFMSNHLHLLVRARGVVLSSFMQFLLANLARKVAALSGWHGTFWHRRFSCEPVLDAEAELGRLRYIVAHGVKEGLVEHASEWPGLSCLNALQGQSERFPFYNWDWRWQRPELRGVGRWSPRLVEWEELELEPISAWAACDLPTRCFLAAQLADRLASEYREARGAARVLGARAVKRQHPHREVALERRATRPWCHASSALVRCQWLRLYREFQAEYRAASLRFRAGAMDVEFPRWAFSPPPGRSAAPSREPRCLPPARLIEESRGQRVAKHVFQPARDVPGRLSATRREPLASVPGEDLQAGMG